MKLSDVTTELLQRALERAADAKKDHVVFFEYSPGIPTWTFTKNEILEELESRRAEEESGY